MRSKKLEKECVFYNAAHSFICHSGCNEVKASKSRQIFVEVQNSMWATQGVKKGEKGGFNQWCFLYTTVYECDEAFTG